MGGDLQGFPAHSEAQYLHAGPGVGRDARNRRWNALSPGTWLRAAGFWLAACSALSGPLARAGARHPRSAEPQRGSLSLLRENAPSGPTHESWTHTADLDKNPDRRRAEFHLIWPLVRPRGRPGNPDRRMRDSAGGEVNARRTKELTDPSGPQRGTTLASGSRSPPGVDTLLEKFEMFGWAIRLGLLIGPPAAVIASSRAAGAKSGHTTLRRTAWNPSASLHSRPAFSPSRRSPAPSSPG
jgi:hypothetical protein